MIKKVEQQKVEELTHRRKGGAFDDFARIFRKINKFVFGNGTIIEDRIGAEQPSSVENPALFVKSKSVFEIYQSNASKPGEYNLMYLGRKGKGENRNTNYIHLNADSKSGESKSANGQIVLTISKDGVVQKGALQIVDMSYYGLNNSGFAINLTCSDDGVSQLSYTEDGINIKYAVAVSKDGIQMFGLPTSLPSIPDTLYKSGTYVKIT